MPNTLIKDRELISYTPGTAEDPGFPGQPAQPQRTVTETRELRIEAAANTMGAFYTYKDNVGGFFSANSLGSVPPAYRGSVKVVWITPLNVLAGLLNEVVSASAAHYSDKWANIKSNGSTSYQPVEWTSAWVLRNKKVTYVTPAVPAIPPRPPTAAKPARSVYNYNLGWTGGAHSAQLLPLGWTGTAEFGFEKPVGIVVGFSAESQTPRAERYRTDHIKYGLVIGDGIVRLREDGFTTETLGTMTGNDAVRAEITGRTIAWFLNDDLVHRGPFALEEDFYLDAMLFSGTDAVVDPALNAGVDVEPDSAALTLLPLSLASSMGTPWNFINKMGAMNMLASEDAICQGDLLMRALRSPFERGNAEMRGARMRSVYVSAAEEGNNAFGRPVSRRMELTGYFGDTWIPTYSIGTLGMLPLVAAADVIGGQSHDYTLAMRALDLMASKDPYGESRLKMLPFTFFGDVEEITPLVRAQELLGAVPTLQALQYIAVVIAETLSATGTITIDAVAVLADASETIGVEDESSVVARILATLVEQLGVFEKYTTLVYRVTGSGGGQVITPVDPGEAWAVNAQTNGSTRYDNYLFNSLMMIKGKPFGVKPQGVYLLEGATDAGTKTQAGVSFGTHDFNTQVLKRIEAVYVGVSSTGALVLKISDGKQEYAYRARRADDRMKVQRFDPGKGLRANYFTFELLAQDGQAFELDNITFNLAATKRRI